MYFMRLLRVAGEVKVLDNVLSWYRLSSSQATKSISPVDVARAQNTVLEENSDLYSRDELVAKLVRNRALLSHFRDKYSWAEEVNRIGGWAALKPEIAEGDRCMIETLNALREDRA